MFNKVQDSASKTAYGIHGPSLHSYIREAADKLEGTNLDFTTFSIEGNYSGGFKNGEKHGFGYVNDVYRHPSSQGCSA